MISVIITSLTLRSHDLMNNSPYCLPYNSYDVSSENLVLDQLIIPFTISLFILITCVLDIVRMLTEEILSWSLMGVTGLSERYLWMASDTQLKAQLTNNCAIFNS